MIAAWLASVASLLSAPTPTNHDIWFKVDDMPSNHLMAGITRTVRVRVTVRPDGSARICEVENSDGDPKLAAHTCRLIMKRGKFTPARWTDGSNSYGVYRETVGWAIDEPEPKYKGSDIDVVVDKLPTGETSPVPTFEVIAVDSGGKPTSCEAAQPTKPRKISNPQLVKLACSALIRDFPAVPAQDDSGENVPSVQNVRVTFVKDQSN